MVFLYRSKKGFFSFFSFIFLLIIFSFVLINFCLSTVKYLSARNEIKRREKEIEMLEKRLVELKNLKEFLETEFYKEKIAREKFDFIKSGEQVIILPQKINPQETEVEKNIKKRSFRSNFKNWWQYFFR